MSESTKMGAFFRSPGGQGLVVGVMNFVSFTAGGALAYFLTKKTLEAKYNQIAESEIAEVRAYYARLNEDKKAVSPAQLLVEKKLKEFGYATPSDDDFPTTTDEDILDEVEKSIEWEVVVQQQNIFENNEPIVDDDFDLEEEKKHRHSNRPYIISHDEFYENQDDLEQITLTYFENDDVLLDEEDAPLPDSEGTVGDNNLMQFGHGSKDNNVVYIRNDTLNVLYEVVRNKGNYARDVLGFIEHADQRGPRRFRRDYE